MFPFVTQPEESLPEPETDPSLMRTIRELRQEKVDLESQLFEIRQKLAETKTAQSSQTGFAPLASIFPMRRDAFGQTKSTSQQLKIYRKDWSTLQDRFTRVNDTGYAYQLEQIIHKKQAKLKSLERDQIGLKVNIEANERKLLKLKSDEAYTSTTANMTNLLSHVSLLRDHINALERSEEQRIQRYQTTDESFQNAQSRYRKMNQIAREFGVSLRASVDQGARKRYESERLKVDILNKKVFFKEEQRVMELIREKRRLEEMGKQLPLEIAAREEKIRQQRDRLQARSARVTPRAGKQSRLRRDLSQQISFRK
jgi:hypothetical protein